MLSKIVEVLFVFLKVVVTSGPKVELEDIWGVCKKVVVLDLVGAKVESLFVVEVKTG